MQRRIVQFGDKINDCFIFPTYEQEDDWGDDVNPATVQLQFGDGSYRALGFDQSLKSSKTLTKRFTLFSPDLKAAYDRIHGISDPNSTAYMTELIDYMYRTLRGGVKKLYAIMEDGSLRYTYGECVTIPYADTFASPKKWIAFSVDFFVHDPYWYEVKNGHTFWYDSIPFSEVVYSVGNPVQKDPTSLVGYNFASTVSQCGYSGVIIDNPALIGETGSSCVLDDNCGWDFGTFGLNDVYPANGLQKYTFQVKGSAGARRPTVTFMGKFLNPKLTNLTTGDVMTFNGILNSTDNVTLVTDSFMSGDVLDMSYSTTLSNFDLTRVLFYSGFFNLEKGLNNIQIEGGQDDSAYLLINFENKYHN